MKEMTERQLAASMMGKASTLRKTKSSRKNGRLGGRPQVYPRCPGKKYHRFLEGVCRFCGFIRIKSQKGVESK